MKRILLILVAMLTLALSGTGHTQQTVLEVITLKYRNADQVIPILRPLLAPGGTISGLQNRVIVRTTPDNLAELQKVLGQIDGAPRRLLISVKQDADASSSLDEAEISGSIGSDRARATVPGTGSNQGGTVVIKRGDDKVKGRALGSQSAATDRSVQTLQVLEGNEAYISVGQSAEYRDVGTGFRVRPRLNGNNVTLEISTQRDSMADQNGQSINVQRVDTVISGRLGQWMELGGIGQQSVQRDSGTVYRRSNIGADNRRVLLKVEEMP